MSTSITGQTRTFVALRHDGSGATAQARFIRRGAWRVERPGVAAPYMVQGGKADAIKAAIADLDKEAS